MVIDVYCFGVHVLFNLLINSIHNMKLILRTVFV